MSDPNEQWTCGKGLAAGAEIPERMGALLEVMARNLELHMRSLDPDNEAGAQELIANQRLIGSQRTVAGYLQALAGEMAGYRDLPMAPHDEAELNAPEVLDAFHALIASERDLASYLTASADAFEEAVASQ
jgi:hypothetical protein